MISMVELLMEFVDDSEDRPIDLENPRQKSKANNKDKAKSMKESSSVSD